MKGFLTTGISEVSMQWCHQTLSVWQRNDTPVSEPTYILSSSLRPPYLHLGVWPDPDVTPWWGRHKLLQHKFKILHKHTCRISLNCLNSVSVVKQRIWTVSGSHSVSQQPLCLSLWRRPHCPDDDWLWAASIQPITAGGVDPGVVVSVDQCVSVVKMWYQLMIDDWAVISLWFNVLSVSVSGVHVVQRMYGCEWDDETGEIYGYDQWGYDGEDFIVFDLKTETWIAPTPQAVITKHKWDNDKAWIAQDKHYLTQICPDWLKKYVDYGRSVLLRTGRITWPDVV